MGGSFLSRPSNDKFLLMLLTIDDRYLYNVTSTLGLILTFGIVPDRLEDGGSVPPRKPNPD
jgi:hypothetical protein